ncbi:hypothetical protein GUJ93_ZPchr0012g20588 [Zizania palustris]|uniref:Uncharacterized protein n=1 Tax=Zizania palustris TaxID=103762 RepID=A0A8J5WRD4_ZIZPA|nr:hypothetical protein GUJ93_ZPchr0012g20588 [Zizania palustris]
MRCEAQGASRCSTQDACEGMGHREVRGVCGGTVLPTGLMTLGCSRRSVLGGVTRCAKTQCVSSPCEETRALVRGHVERLEA